MRHILNDYSKEWEFERQEEKRKLLKQGIIPFYMDVKIRDLASSLHQVQSLQAHLKICGPSKMECKWCCRRSRWPSCGALNIIMPAKDVVEEIMADMLTIRGFSKRFSSCKTSSTVRCVSIYLLFRSSKFN